MATNRYTYEIISRYLFDAPKPQYQYAQQLAPDGKTLVGPRLELRNFDAAIGGTGKDDIRLPNRKNFANAFDPLVLDLDGDGFSLSMLELSSPRFDIEALVPDAGFADLLLNNHTFLERAAIWN